MGWVDVRQSGRVLARHPPFPFGFTSIVGGLRGFEVITE